MVEVPLDGHLAPGWLAKDIFLKECNIIEMKQSLWKFQSFKYFKFISRKTPKEDMKSCIFSSLKYIQINSPSNAIDTPYQIYLGLHLE